MQELLMVLNIMTWLNMSKYDVSNSEYMTMDRVLKIARF